MTIVPSQMLDEAETRALTGLDRAGLDRYCLRRAT
jgi:DNA-directed RNA polymerase subunit N (RpoN/RPB10)